MITRVFSILLSFLFLDIRRSKLCLTSQQSNFQIPTGHLPCCHRRSRYLGSPALDSVCRDFHAGFSELVENCFWFFHRFSSTNLLDCDFGLYFPSLTRNNTLGLTVNHGSHFVDMYFHAPCLRVIAHCRCYCLVLTVQNQIK